MNYVVSIKRDYLPNYPNADNMEWLFKLPYSYNEEKNYYIFSSQDGEDKLYIVESLPFCGQLPVRARITDTLDQINLDWDCFWDWNCLFIFHDKDIQNENDQYGDSYHAPFCQKEYKGHSYWLFQHVSGDEIYDLLTSKVLDMHYLFERLKELLEI